MDYVILYLYNNYIKKKNTFLNLKLNYCLINVTNLAFFKSSTYMLSTCTYIFFNTY